MKKIAKNQKAAAILAETELQNVGGGWPYLGAGCLTCGLVIAFDPGIYIDPVLPQINPALGQGLGVGP